LAAEVASSSILLTTEALRSAIEAAVARAALDAHYAEHPGTRPSIAQVALALAAQDGSPLADRPDLIDRAAAELLGRHPDAGPEDGLLWVEAQAAVSS
jgi:hypothetical protein